MITARIGVSILSFCILFPHVSTSLQRTPTPPKSEVRLPRTVKTLPKNTVPREQKKKFAQSYSNLIQSLNEFSEAYEKSKGETLPIDKVKAVKKAWRELQAIEPAFK